MKKFGYVYETKNKINERSYIGQHIGPVNSRYLGSGLQILRAINKYGVESFEVKVLAYARSKNELDKLERRYIAEYRKLFPGQLYNIHDGGAYGSHAPSSLKKLSISLKKLYSDPKVNRELRKNLRKVHASPEFSEKMKLVALAREPGKGGMNGKHHSVKTNKKRSKAMKKVYLNDPESFGMAGKHHSEASRKAIGLANSGPNPNRRVPKSKSCVENMKKGWIKRRAEGKGAPTFDTILRVKVRKAVNSFLKKQPQEVK